MSIAQLLQQSHTPQLRRILLLGAECTGKTTLCQDLAQAWQTTWTPEYMRSYLQQKWDVLKQSCEWHDLLPIAIGQMQSENQHASQAQNYLFCDTGLWEIMAYSYWYYQDCPTLISQMALQHQYDMILIPEVDDIEWQADDLRDLPHQRGEMIAFFKQFLQRHQRPFVSISGSRQQRLAQVNRLLANSPPFPI